MKPRRVVNTVTGREAFDGAGVRLRRVLGTPPLDHVDPFLLLDEFRSDSPDDYLAGFPDHPHRGFETVTYMLAGAMRHRDHRGNEGHLRAGDVQWMTAGRGIVHSEMPEQEDGLMWGFQLWVNLPASHKMMEPRYQDIRSDAIPEVTLPGAGRVRVIAGSAHGVEGPVRGIVTEPLYLDLRLPPGGAVVEPVATGHSAFAYAFEGEAEVGEPATPLPRGTLAVLGDGDAVSVRAGDRGARLLLVTGRPLREPIARRGPFVMNTQEEILQAIRDYQDGRLQA